MNKPHKPITILLADDDPEDRMLAHDALQESRVANRLDMVVDGEDLMDYLYRRGAYESLKGTPLPGLILLDLNMPRKDGREALREIKSDPKLRRIPVVVLTTSESDDDIQRTYDLGANSFIVKPRQFDAVVEMMRTLTCYWFGTIQPPPKPA